VLFLDDSNAGRRPATGVGSVRERRHRKRQKTIYRRSARADHRRANPIQACSTTSTGHPEVAGKAATDCQTQRPGLTLECYFYGRVSMKSRRFRVFWRCWDIRNRRGDDRRDGLPEGHAEKIIERRATMFWPVKENQPPCTRWSRRRSILTAGAFRRAPRTPSTRCRRGSWGASETRRI